MRFLNQHLTVLSVSVVVAIASTSLVRAEDVATEESEPRLQSIFNGKSLEGWEGKEDWFRVEDEAIVAGTQKKKIPNNEFLCTTKEYGDFELKLKAKLVGEGDNAGIQIRSKRIENHHEMIGYQCDMGMMNERPIWGSLYDESRRRKFLAHGDEAKVKAAFREDGWNEFRILCKGKRIQIWLNDVQTVDYTEEDNEIPQSGKIGLQIHSGKPAEAMYKDIQIRELSSAK